MIPITKPLVPDKDLYSLHLKHTFESGQFSNDGPFVKELEKKLKLYLGVKNNAAFCNGTTALMVALKSLNLEGSVITTPFTFPATLNAIEWCGLNPVFCDVDYDTMNIDPWNAEKQITGKVSAILPVHVFGNPCRVHGFNHLSEIYNLKIVYDAAHAFGSKVGNAGIGTFGDITMFSFHPTKLFHTGEGGMLTYNDPELDIKIKQLRNFGIRNEVDGSVLPGLNGKMGELQGALGLCVLQKLKEEIKKRKKVFKLYKKYLSEIPFIKTFDINEGTIWSYQYFPIRVKRFRNLIHGLLEKKGISSRKYFYPLCSDFPYYKNIKSRVPNAIRVSEEVLCLPFYGDLSKDDIEMICEIIKKGDKK